LDFLSVWHIISLYQRKNKRHILEKSTAVAAQGGKMRLKTTALLASLDLYQTAPISEHNPDFDIREYI